MDPLSPLPAIVAIFFAVMTALALVRALGAPNDKGRFATIDGLRGYLAFFVFLHHSSIWYSYLQTGEWLVPRSNLYAHFGQSSVVLFFMVTGFLFFSKLLDGRSRQIDWLRLYVSRFLRLVPLYAFAMLILISIVAYISRGELNDSPSSILAAIMRWMFFTIRGNPDVNKVQDTYIIVAGVPWTLPYEWFFYFSLPLLALIVGASPPRPYVALGVGGVLFYFIISDHNARYVAPFLGGIAAALVHRVATFRRIATTSGASIVIMVCVVGTVFAFPTPFEPIPLTLLSIAFALIACGNDLFGTLVSAVSRSLGEASYSIYLLQGLVLYVSFSLVLDPSTSRSLSALDFWADIVLLTPIFISICFLTFRLIERPAMHSTPRLTAWIRSQSERRS